MASLRLTRSFNRARISSERGFVLGAALLLAVLYFALMELLLLDSTLQLQQADRFRAHVQAAALAETGAELAAANMVTSGGAEVKSKDEQGSFEGRYVRNGCCQFLLDGEATTNGVPAATAWVRLKGSFSTAADGSTRVAIDWSTHSQ